MRGHGDLLRSVRPSAPLTDMTRLGRRSRHVVAVFWNMRVDTCITDPVDNATDRVFKALADPTRRCLLDRLRHKNGQTLGELCEHLEMARQSATQHLDVLEDA